MKTKILLLLIFTTSYLTAQIVNIPDPTFKSYLLYNFDTNNDHEIQVAEAQAATGGIYVAGDPFVWGEITDLTGIEAFVNITDLQCQLNLIDQPVDLSNNLALTRVKCYENSIPSLILGANTVLTELDCHDNNITSLDVSQCTALEDLDCYYNSLYSVNLNGAISLQNINFNYNNLVSIDISTNLSLIKLYAHHNNITSINMSNNIALETLVLGDNQFDNIAISNNTNLKVLGCNGNNLVMLDLRNNNNTIITDFDATNNPNLTCIFVDDAAYSTENWLNIDETSHFVETQEECDALKTDDFLSLQEISIFPNPTKGVFTLNLNTVTPNTNYQISIHNMIGERLFKSQISNPQSIIDITHLPAGIYFLTIKTNNKQTLTHKIIKL